MPPQNTANANVENEDLGSFEFGRMLANPLPGEEVVISGLSGCFPNSYDVNHFKDNLYGKVDMVSDDNRRWEPTHPEIPQRTGKIWNVEKFDPGFFGLHEKQTHAMDPMVRIHLEKAVEAILDAGLHPSDLAGTNTGVFVGACFSESEKSGFYDILEAQRGAIQGLQRSMIARRVSKHLDLKGPSFICDTACSSSLYALEHAYKAIRLGQCDKAIVGGANLCLHPFVSLQFARLGVLSMDGRCKAFDNNGNGYARSEAIAAILLEKSKDAKRVYAQILHAKTNCDGYKEQGITYPSGDMQRKLLQEFYQECSIDPTTLNFLEAHGTGTKVGDPEEVNAIDSIFCTNRQTPLPMGSVKSSIGHSEPTSGLCSITKVIIGMENGFIPPNMYYSTPRAGVEALEQGRIKVVTDKMPFEDDRGLIGVNSFGFGGGNCHVLLRWNTKSKLNGGEPKDDLPRLVCVSGRAQESIPALLDNVNSKKLDAEHVALLHNIFRKNIPTHIYRGFSIVTKNGEAKRSFRYFSGQKGGLYFAFGGFDSTWQMLGKHLYALPLFAATIQRIQHVLSKTGLNLAEIIQNSKQLSTHPVLNKIIGNIAVQLAIVDLLKTLEITADGIVGYGLGEISCAYACGSISLEQAVMVAYEIANTCKEINQPSLCYVVEMSYQKLQQILPEGIQIVGVNSNSYVTILGNLKSMTQFIGELRKLGIKNASEIGLLNINFYNKDLAKIETNLLSNLRKILPNSVKKGSKWLTSKDQKISAEYFVKTLTSVQHFDDLTKNIPKDSIIFEVGNGFFSKLLEHSLDESIGIVSFEHSFDKLDMTLFLDAIGRLYELGYNPQIQNLYPKIQWPVSRGTSMISPYIRWNHSKDWFVSSFELKKSLKFGEKTIDIAAKEETWAYALGHLIDGRQLFPATGYLQCVWHTLSNVNSMLQEEMNIIFENVKFLRSNNIHKDDFLELTVMIQRGSGNFEIIEGGTPVVTGRVYFTNDITNEQITLPIPTETLGQTKHSIVTKDIYKELRIRGYNYKGEFRGIQQCNTEASVGMVKWTGNWVTFIDNMLQMQILQVDTRLLYVPTSIRKLSISSKDHINFAKSLGENPVLPVYAYKDLGIVKCGGIEIRGLRASSIARRRPRSEPVLERYNFIPNEATLKAGESVRVNLQIALENLNGIKVKVVELIDEATIEGLQPLSPLVHEVLGDLPLIQPNITILSKNSMEVENVSVEDKKLVAETDCALVIGTNLLQRAVVLQQAFGALRENGFVLSRENPAFQPNSLSTSDVEILTVHTTENEKLVFFRKTVERKTPVVIKVTNENFEWLPELQTAMKKDNSTIVYAQDESLSGILGLFNCIRREPGGLLTNCFLMLDKTPDFNLDNPFYQEQFKKNMAVNVFKDGRWGTYRHLLLSGVEEIETQHAYISQTVRGDLSKLRWIEGPLNLQSRLPPEQNLVTVYYASLNFRDVMTASGRINADVVTTDRTKQECVQGFEFSGRDCRGKRVMGMVTHGALATLIDADSYLAWDVPDHWTLEEAATIPVVYGTVMYALLIRCNIRKGQSILIHSGSGGIGQAAITLCLHYGLTVYTTVGTQEKREFLKKRFPQLTDRCIGNSRDTSFETMISIRTNGRGVDYVLNSLADDKLIASVRCLARGGSFVEIGKYDLANDSKLNLLLMEKEASFKGIMLDQLMTCVASIKTFVRKMVYKLIDEGAIRPLPRTVFKDNEVEEAFRFMASGKHIGKVIIAVRKEEKEKVVVPTHKLVKALPRYTCDPDAVYIIAGGLGGFGLELADWLVIRGARKLVLTSRTGIRTGYHIWRIGIWKSYGARIEVSTDDIKTENGCKQLIVNAQKLGPIKAIFNLAVVLKDALLENQTQENFAASFGPKANATLHLDKVTRKMCPNLVDFVVFSSVSCGRGNAGQTNYGMANSVMERICEARKRDGYPALAIEWGAIGDVGLVAEMQDEHIDMEIGGTLQQRISNCMQCLDVFLKQKEASIVSSMVVAEKRSGAGGADNIVDAVANILGVKNLKTISLHATLAELGMDSMTAVEIKQTLEREYEVFLTAQDIRSMTFARLMEIQEERASGDGTTKKAKPLQGMDAILTHLGDEATSTMPIYNLKTMIKDEEEGPTVFCFPGIEGFATTLKPLASSMKAHLIGLQFCYKFPQHNYLELAENALEQIEMRLPKGAPFLIITYSWGTIIGLEAIARLEAKGHQGEIFVVDGSPGMLKQMHDQELKNASEAEFETLLLCRLMGLYIPYEIILKNKEKIYKCNNFEERMNVAQQVAPEDTPHSPYYQRQVAIGLCTRLKELKSYSPSYNKIKSKVHLFKPSQPVLTNLPNDYYLSEFCEQPINVHVLEGNHVTILENTELADLINSTLAPEEDNPENTKVEDVSVEIKSDKICNGSLPTKIQNEERTI